MQNLRSSQKTFSLLFFPTRWLPWRHVQSNDGGHVGVQNNAVKCLLGIWLYYYAKLEKFPKDLFAIVLYNKMAAVTSRAIKRFSIGGFHLTSRRPCWCTKQRCKMSFGNLTIIMQKLVEPFSIALYANIATSSRGCKPRIKTEMRD